MLVSAAGAQVGTIGGGRVEYEVVQCAQDVAGGAPIVSVTHNLVRDLGMCCGGSMTFFVQPLVPCLSAIEDAMARQVERVPCWLQANVQQGGMEVLASAPLPSVEVLSHELGIKVLPHARVVLMGCGHLSRAIGPLAADLGFEVVLCDDNETSAIDEKVKWAAFSIPSFELRDIEIAIGPLGEQDYILILTRDHAIDQSILETFLPRIESLAYLGLIGSLGKIGRFRKRIMAKGSVSEAQWSALHGPIGLDISAETPLEIAVSILAQLIAIKNRNEQGRAVE